MTRGQEIINLIKEEELKEEKDLMYYLTESKKRDLEEELTNYPEADEYFGKIKEEQKQKFDALSKRLENMSIIES